MVNPTTEESWWNHIFTFIRINTNQRESQVRLLLPKVYFPCVPSLGPWFFRQFVSSSYLWNLVFVLLPHSSLVYCYCYTWTVLIILHHTKTAESTRLVVSSRHTRVCVCVGVCVLNCVLTFFSSCSGPWPPNRYDQWNHSIFLHTCQVKFVVDAKKFIFFCAEMVEGQEKVKRRLQRRIQRLQQTRHLPKTKWRRRSYFGCMFCVSAPVAACLVCGSRLNVLFPRIPVWSMWAKTDGGG